MFSQKKYEYIKADLEALENKTASQIGASTRSLGKEYSLSKSNIARLIRINHLIDSLKARVDAGNIAVYAAVDLSYLSTSEQEFIESVLAKDDKFKVDMKKAALLREYSGKLTYETAYDMISGKIKGELKEKTVKTINIDIEVYEKYFNGKSKKEAEDLIIQAIVEYFENRGGHESTESAPSDENKSEQAGDSKEMDESESIKGVGTKVKIKDLSRDEEVEYILVDSSKVDPRNKKISPESPLGEVLINSKKGDIKEYKTRAKGKEPDKIRIQILEFWNSWNDAS
jgi:transcription elongation GreA/GreB family factor